MKLKRPIKIVIVPIAMFLGWLAMGIGYTIPLSPSINTILFVGGFFVCIGGIIWLIIIAVKLVVQLAFAKHK
jgi:hypothetical protein